MTDISLDEDTMASLLVAAVEAVGTAPEGYRAHLIAALEGMGVWPPC